MSPDMEKEQKPVTATAILLALFVCVAWALVLGTIYAFAVNSVSLIYFRVFVSAAFGVILGSIVSRAGRSRGIRDKKLLTRMTFVTVFAGFYAAWAFDGIARLGYDHFPNVLFRPDTLGRYIGAFYQDSLWSIGRFLTGGEGIAVSGIVLALVWMAEIAIVLMLALRGVRNAARRFPNEVPRRRLLSFRIPELPLLRRELTELSNRRRTYVVRVIGACILLFFVFLAYEQAMFQREQLMGMYGGFFGPSRYLGIGGAVFAAITPMLFYAIQLLMPALCCAALTAEKENNTIGTLLLTRLSPGTIVLEKVCSRVVPMLTILLLAFPVLAHVHSLGGVDTDQLIGTIWLLLTECFLIASVSILFSSWFATTTAAFIWSYAFIAFMLVMSLSLEITTFLPSAIWQESFSGSDRYTSPAQQAMMKAMGMIPPTAAPGGSLLAQIIRNSISAWMVTAMFLFIARLFVVRRAFVSQSSVLLKVFRVVDGFFKALNDRTTGGIEIIKDSNPLPHQDPVAWRERNKKSLGKARYLFRILIVLEVPTLFVCLLAATISARASFEGLYVLQCLIWVLCGLIAAVKGATLFSSERAKETIEPLLATPMTAREILSQKVAGMRRLLIVLAVPILSVNATHFLLHFNFSSILNGIVSWRPLAYMILSVWNTVILLYLITWVTTGIGLFIHSQTKAVVVAVAFMAIWVIIPIVLASAMRAESPEREVIMTFSPYSLIEANERFLAGAMYFGGWQNNTDEVGKTWWRYTLQFHAVMIVVIWLVVRKWTPAMLNRRENRAVPFAGIATSRVPVLERGR